MSVRKELTLKAGGLFVSAGFLETPHWFPGKCWELLCFPLRVLSGLEPEKRGGAQVCFTKGEVTLTRCPLLR